MSDESRQDRGHFSNKHQTFLVAGFSARQHPPFSVFALASVSGMRLAKRAGNERGRVTRGARGERETEEETEKGQNSAQIVKCDNALQDDKKSNLLLIVC